jgi:hypothetical protein
MFFSSSLEVLTLSNNVRFWVSGDTAETYEIFHYVHVLTFPAIFFV